MSYMNLQDAAREIRARVVDEENALNGDLFISRIDNVSDCFAQQVGDDVAFVRIYAILTGNDNGETRNYEFELATNFEWRKL